MDSSQPFSLDKTRPYIVVALIALVSLSLVLRTAHLRTTSPTFREAYNYNLANTGVAQTLRISSENPYDAHPPLYTLFLKLNTFLWEDSFLALRIVSVVCSLVYCVLAYFLVRVALTGDSKAIALQTALFAAALVGMNAYLVWDDQHVDVGGVFRLVLLASTLALLLATDETRSAWRWRWLYAVSAVVLVFIHRYGWAPALGQLCYLAVAEFRRRRPPGASWIVPGLMAAPVCIAIAAMLSDQFRSIQPVSTWWLSCVSQFKTFPAPWHLCLELFTVPRQYWADVEGFESYVFLVAGVLGVLLLWRTGTPLGKMLSLLLIVTLVSAAICAAVGVPPERRLWALRWFDSAGVLILVSIALLTASIPVKEVRFGVVGLLLGLSLWNCYRENRLPYFASEQGLQRVGQQLAEFPRDKSCVVVACPKTFLSLRCLVKPWTGILWQYPTVPHHGQELIEAASTLPSGSLDDLARTGVQRVRIIESSKYARLSPDCFSGWDCVSSKEYYDWYPETLWVRDYVIAGRQPEVKRRSQQDSALPLVNAVGSHFQ